MPALCPTPARKSTRNGCGKPWCGDRTHQLYDVPGAKADMPWARLPLDGNVRRNRQRRRCELTRREFTGSETEMRLPMGYGSRSLWV